MTRLLFLLFAVLLSGCVVGTVSTQPSRTSSAPSTSVTRMQDADFAAEVKRVEPVAENMCREASPKRNCDFLILEDNRAGAPSNAFQTRDKAGRPVIIFTKALLDDMENSDEIAFVLGHETAHHIEDHLPRTNESAMSGAMVAGIIIAAAGGDPAMVQQAQEFGAIAGARAYSKQFELEADALGTVIAIRSGFDPVRGAEFFSRLPDPGDQFLGTHPMNAERQQVVRRTAARYR